MKKQEGKSLGQWGEDLAVKSLEAKGYQVLERNFRIGRKEIDIVVSKGSVIAFVEVKTRRSSGFGAPELSVDERKQRQIIAVAEGYLQQATTEQEKWTYRFDVVAISCGRGGNAEVRHIEDAFRIR